MQEAQDQIQQLFEKYPNLLKITLMWSDGIIECTFMHHKVKRFSTLTELIEYLEKTQL